MKFTPELRELQYSSIQKSWIPKESDIYAWCEHTTRHGDLHFGKVISYDKEKQLVRGYIGGASERRHRGNIFLIPSIVASRLELQYLNKKIDVDTVIPSKINPENSWSDEWPTEVGLYWFYGFPFGENAKDWRKKDKELYLVKLWNLANELVYQTDGTFFYKQDGGTGKWQRAILPKLPKEIK
jgi:hypothetical protein